ncbi:MAG: alpha/beta hydrolase [Actinomycetota bacterium]
MFRSARIRLIVVIAIAVLASSCANRLATDTASNSAPQETTTTTTTTSLVAEPEATAEPDVDPSAPTDTASAQPATDIAPVFAEPTFDVRVTTDIVYAQALSHNGWGSETAEPIDLLLDVYEPVRTDDVTMPAVVMIHGGGFTGGSKEHGALSSMAHWFAERGWVAYSINYRLAGDTGTLPAEYPQPPIAVPQEQADQWRALYPACRDAKAAIRWVKATADDFSIDPDHVAVVGGSAGSNLAITLGVSDEGDCTDEVSIDDDPTLASTNLDQSSSVATVIDHWGGSAVLTMLGFLDSGSRFDPTDAPVSIVHGTADTTVDFAEAENLRSAYESTGVPYAWHPLEGAGHAAWRATIDGRPLVESAADFIIETQRLDVR